MMVIRPFDEGEIFEAPWVGYGILPLPNGSLVDLDKTDGSVGFLECMVSGHSNGSIYNHSTFCIRFSYIVAYANGQPWVTARITSIKNHYFGSIQVIRETPQSAQRIIENIHIAQLSACLTRMQPDSAWAWQC